MPGGADIVLAMVDIHCHILPGLDDGARDMETSVEMCRVAAEDGIEATVCSMHANDQYAFDPELVQKTIDQVMSQTGGKPRLYPGCDFHLSYQNITNALREPKRYTINHGSYLLVEFADFAVPPNIDEVFFQFRSRGMIPIITHPERNPWLMGARHKLFEWVDAGALVQVTAGSLTGRFGERAGRFSEWLLEHRMLHFVATDAHNVNDRPPRLTPAYERVAKDFGRDVADRIFRENPRAALESQEINAEPPVAPSAPRKQTFLGRLAATFRR